MFPYWRHLGGFLQPLVSGSACLMLVCLRSTFTQVSLEEYFRTCRFCASWFDSGYMLLPLYVFVGTRIL